MDEAVAVALIGDVEVVVEGVVVVRVEIGDLEVAAVVVVGPGFE